MTTSKSHLWDNDLWCISSLNFTNDVRAGLNINPNLRIADCTLRDGEQQPGVIFQKEDKIRIAELLDAIGIHEIEAGMPAVSKDDAEAIREINRRGLKSKITALARATKEDIDIVADLGCWGVILSLPVGYLQLKHKLKWSEEKVIDTALIMAKYAREKGLYVIMSPYDTTRADLNFFKNYLAAITENSIVDRIRLVDTTGAIMPRAIGVLVNFMRKTIGKLPIEVHCHNDFGLATATTLAAAEAGVDVLSTTINGLGERAGNTATEEVAVALRVLYGLDLEMDLTILYKVSQEIQKISRVRLQPHKALVGKNAFSHESGLIVQGVLENHFAGESISPELVGRTCKILIGKKSGLATIAAKLKEMNLEVNVIKQRDILEKVKEVSIKKEKLLDDAEFRAIAEKFLV
jgi:isopropylmalate/homocitrate/citramalate synthase